MVLRCRISGIQLQNPLRGEFGLGSITSGNGTLSHDRLLDLKARAADAFARFGLQANDAGDPAAIRGYLRERPTGYKGPKVVQFAADLPRECSGKIRKRKLRNPFWAGTGRHI